MLALQVIEHLPTKHYDQVLKEICRVSSRYVMISVPYKEDLDLTLIVCPECRTRFNPNYHMREFDDEQMETLLGQYGFDCFKLVHIGVVHRYRLIFRMQSVMALLGEKGNYWPFEIPCPVCGHLLPAVEAPQGKHAPVKMGSIFRGFLKKIWPRITVPTKVLGIYQKSPGTHLLEF